MSSLRLQFVICVFVVTWFYFLLRFIYPSDIATTSHNMTLNCRNMTTSDHMKYPRYQLNALNKSKRDTQILSSFENTSMSKSTNNNSKNVLTTDYRSLPRDYRIKKTKVVLGKFFDSMPYLVYPLFQSTEEIEFPTIDTDFPRIPHIIHQMYIDEMIPELYLNHVKSFIRNNPTWEYRYWTDESGRKLLKKHHPYLVKVFDNFGKSVKRSDLLRYVVLYEYGGFYADLDTENFRSLNIATKKYACIVPVEPFENSVLHYNMDYLMCNAVMGCRAKHPFFKKLLWNLQWDNPATNPVETTGPIFLTRMFNEYNHIEMEDEKRNKSDWSSNSPYFYKGELREVDDDAVYVPNSQYFMDLFNPSHVEEDGKFTRLCKSIEQLSILQQRACTEMYSRRHVRENQKYAFTVHVWYHLWLMNKSNLTALKKIHIRDIVPNCILYE